jgi:hypothetical protein
MARFITGVETRHPAWGVTLRDQQTGLDYDFISRGGARRGAENILSSEAMGEAPIIIPRSRNATLTDTMEIEDL